MSILYDIDWSTRIDIREIQDQESREFCREIIGMIQTSSNEAYLKANKTRAVVRYFLDQQSRRTNLDFADLRNGNQKRLPLFKNSKGEAAHSEPDGSDWTLGEWMNAVAGEVGEAANLIKKVRRGDKTLDESREEIGKELADVVCYLDLVAFRAGIDLGEVVRKKFNEVSDRIGVEVKI